LRKTAEEIEILLSAEVLNYEYTVSFVLRAADVPVSSAAYSYAAERKWLSAKTATGGDAALNEISLLIMVWSGRGSSDYRVKRAL
jgi:hypothetical protein